MQQITLAEYVHLLQVNFGVVSLMQTERCGMCFPFSCLKMSALKQFFFTRVSSLCADSPSPGPEGLAVGWWSRPPGSTPPVTLCRRGRSRSLASFHGGS